MFDINQAITDHINSIEEPGVRDWLTKLHEAKAFYFSVDAVAYYQYQQQDWGCLSYGEMKHILGVLKAIETEVRVDAFRHLAQLKVEHEIRTYCIDGSEYEFPSISVGGLAVDAGLYKAGDTNA